ncbi:MAG: prolyl aminopeptidase [Acidobacteria bacterium]|nr:prolyl aminopeptidase [Acidobacteriota bacterium]
MRTFYPPIEPNRHGMLDVGDGNQLYWEECGNPAGKPVVFLHGGPGGGSSANHRRLFDPARYRIILLDQRNCGRSIPSASDFATDLSANTTWNLVADLEVLREHLDIGRWQVFGGSWGSSLALAYAETHPERVTELVVRGVFTLRRSELEWFYEGPCGNMAPDFWAGYIAAVPPAERRFGNYIAAYARMLADPDPAIHGPAAVAWSTWEASTITLLPRPDLITTFAEPSYALAFARIENHFFLHDGWFEPGQLLRDAGRLADIPTVIVQGRYDLCTPATTAWELHEALPSAEFVLVDDAGHSSDEPGILDALITATDRFAGNAG